MSQMTYIDGNKGKLLYRGISVGYLFDNYDYEDVLHLLIWKEFPTPETRRQFRARIAQEMTPDASIIRTIRGFGHNTEAYLMVAAGLCAWAASRPESIPVCAGDRLYLGNIEAIDDTIYRTIAALMTVTAIVSCYKENKVFKSDVDSELSPIDNMLRMMGHMDTDGKIDKKMSATIKKLWILFADHEMTSSTAAFLHAASSLSDPISSSAAAILGVQGPLHAGAIALAFKRFERISRSEGGVMQHIEDVKTKKCRAMGVGHRLYRIVDPRIGYIKQLILQLKTEIASDPLLEVAMGIEEAVRNDEYFTSRKLSINAGLYGSFVYANL
jgi:citrate synthase